MPSSSSSSSRHGGSRLSIFHPYRRLTRPAASRPAHIARQKEGLASHIPHHPHQNIIASETLHTEDNKHPLSKCACLPKKKKMEKRRWVDGYGTCLPACFRFRQVTQMCVCLSFRFLLGSENNVRKCSTYHGIRTYRLILVSSPTETEIIVFTGSKTMRVESCAVYMRTRVRDYTYV